MSSGGVANVLKALQLKGYVSVMQAKEDRRSRTFVLEPSGARVCKDVVCRLEQKNFELFGKMLSKREQAGLSSPLGKVPESLRQVSRQSAWWVLRGSHEYA